MMFMFQRNSFSEGKSKKIISQSANYNFKVGSTHKMRTQTIMLYINLYFIIFIHYILIISAPALQFVLLYANILFTHVVQQ